jgi:hypothetical protein
MLIEGHHTSGLVIENNPWMVQIGKALRNAPQLSNELIPA